MREASTPAAILDTLAWPGIGQVCDRLRCESSRSGWQLPAECSGGPGYRGRAVPPSSTAAGGPDLRGHQQLLSQGRREGSPRGRVDSLHVGGNQAAVLLSSRCQSVGPLHHDQVLSWSGCLVSSQVLDQKCSRRSYLGVEELSLLSAVRMRTNYLC